MKILLKSCEPHGGQGRTLFISIMEKNIDFLVFTDSENHQNIISKNIREKYPYIRRPFIWPLSIIRRILCKG